MDSLITHLEETKGCCGGLCLRVTKHCTSWPNRNSIVVVDHNRNVHPAYCILAYGMDSLITHLEETKGCWGGLCRRVSVHRTSWPNRNGSFLLRCVCCVCLTFFKFWKLLSLLLWLVLHRRTAASGDKNWKCKRLKQCSIDAMLHKAWY